MAFSSCTLEADTDSIPAKQVVMEPTPILNPNIPFFISFKDKKISFYLTNLKTYP